ncbi:hypothetical protein [Frigoribacterium sp. CFBP9030]|uniref:hypothetical protein n=1 Tax=Frigoribacterium sp. CFBP9030 TaxID=3096537 RepID=UPI002A6A3392|nr:hypothetical protein [Frigoribacterium sp. CFBP9030]MDY0892085.1 hypothetical protein [Frigoribacterium sp. CFBP9030]
MAAAENDPNDPTTRPAAPEGLDILADDASGVEVGDRPAASRRLGLVTFVLALALLALDGIAVALLAGDLVTPAATIALVTMLASIVVGVVALVAVVLRRGRWFAVAAVLLSVLANPFVLVFLLARVLPAF